MKEYNGKTKQGRICKMEDQKLYDITCKITKEWELLNQLEMVEGERISAMKYCLIYIFEKELNYRIPFSIAITGDGYLKCKFRNDSHLNILSKTVNLSKHVEVRDGLLIWFVNNVKEVTKNE